MAYAILDMVGKTLYDADHQKIGKIDNIYVRGPNKEPVFASVSSGFLGIKETLVPLAMTHFEENDVVANTKKDVIKYAPTISGDELTKEDEQAFYQYYTDALRPTESSEAYQAQESTQPPQTQPADRKDYQPDYSPQHEADRAVLPDVPQQPDGTLTRHEEEMQVGTKEEESGRAYVRKYVVTDDAAVAVPTSHEEVRIEREPVRDAQATDPTEATFGDEEREITLHQEVPVVEKKVVPKEQVRITKETVSDQQTVHDQARKEQIESETDQS